MRTPDPYQLVSIITDHDRKLERLETLGTPAGALSHDTLLAYTPSGAVGAIGRLRLLPGTGRGYRCISWAIACDLAGSVVIDVLQAAGYPPPTSMCPVNRPSCVGSNHSTGSCAGWARTAIAHGDWLIINIFSLAGIGEVGFSLELEPT